MQSKEKTKLNLTAKLFLIQTKFFIGYCKTPQIKEANIHWFPAVLKALVGIGIMRNIIKPLNPSSTAVSCS